MFHSILEEGGLWESFSSLVALDLKVKLTFNVTCLRVKRLPASCHSINIIGHCSVVLNMWFFVRCQSTKLSALLQSVFDRMKTKSHIVLEKQASIIGGMSSSWTVEIPFHCRYTKNMPYLQI